MPIDIEESVRPWQAASLILGLALFLGGFALWIVSTIISNLATISTLQSIAFALEVVGFISSCVGVTFGFRTIRRSRSNLLIQEGLLLVARSSADQFVQLVHLKRP